MAARTPTRRAAASHTLTRSAARSVPPSSLVADIQRARLLAGAVRAIDEFGYTRTTVTEITACAHVSRRTFYELFTNSEDCLGAMLDEMVGRIRSQLVGAALNRLAWRERVRMGLWTILSFLDREPALARVCVVQSARGGEPIIERREQLLKELAEIIDQGRHEDDLGRDCSPLIAEGLIGAALSILHTRLMRSEKAPLSDLHAELMAMILLPYLGPAAARKERKRKAPESTPMIAERNGAARGTGAHTTESPGDPLQGISMRLTYRTVCVLEAVFKQPGLSNRAVGDASGISDQGQISKLLARLERYRLLENRGAGSHAKGEPNVWHLTSAGRSVTQVVATSIRNQGEDV